MKQLLVKIAVFAALVFVVDTAFGFVMKWALAGTTKGDWGRRNYILNETHEDILIFGSSRAIHHYDTRILTDSLHLSCYNCGDDGKGILLHYPVLETILQRYTPKIVIYDITPSYDFRVLGEINTLSTLRPYTDLSPIEEFVEDVEPKEQLKLFSQFYKYNSTFLEILPQLFSSHSLTAMQYTYSPLEGEMSYEPANESVHGGHGVDSIKYHYLEGLIELCHKNGVKLCFAASPWYKMGYSNVFDPVEKLCRKHDILFLNHNFDNRFNMNRNYFHDTSHLNCHGAEIYSSMVAHELKNTYGDSVLYVK